MSRAARKSPLEKRIQTEIEAAIGSEPDLLLLRNSTGHAEYFNEADGKSWHVPYGLGVGSPDLVGLLKRGDFAVWFCLEVKSEVGTVSEEQAKCHRIWKRFGAMVFVVRNVEEAKKALSIARRA